MACLKGFPADAESWDGLPDHEMRSRALRPSLSTCRCSSPVGSRIS